MVTAGRSVVGGGGVEVGEGGDSGVWSQLAGPWLVGEGWGRVVIVESGRSWEVRGWWGGGRGGVVMVESGRSWQVRGWWGRGGGP